MPWLSWIIDSFKFVEIFQVFDLLVRAAFLAAACLFFGPFVAAAFMAAAERSSAVRFLVASCACFDSDSRVAAEVPSRFRAVWMARDLLTEGGRLGAAPWPRA